MSPREMIFPAVVTPVQLRNGRYYKREDIHRMTCGVNGSKLRACEYLIRQARDAGKRRVISAASVLSPQNAMAAVLARRYGMACTVVVGGTKARTAARHPSINIALKNGARLEIIGVGYNPALQRHAAELAAADPGAYWLRYGITTPPDASPAELIRFHSTSADQVPSLPTGVQTLVIPFGSGNTGCGVLYGIKLHALENLVPEHIVLMGIGPDRRAWLKDRMDRMGVVTPDYEFIDLHGSGYASYGDRMPGTVDGIRLHPTYEGKVVRYLNERRPSWWTGRDGSTCLWIVGGPLK